jgi:hypothetical protein
MFVLGSFYMDKKRNIFSFLHNQKNSKFSTFFDVKTLKNLKKNIKSCLTGFIGNILYYYWFSVCYGCSIINILPDTKMS